MGARSLAVCLAHRVHPHYYVIGEGQNWTPIDIPTATGLACDEFHLAAIVQNLKTLANHIWLPWRNTPDAFVA